MTQRSVGQHACYEGVSACSLKNFCAAVLLTVDGRKQAVSTHRVNAFYKNGASAHQSIKFIDRLYGEEVDYSGNGGSLKQMANCVTGGYLLRTDDDFDNAARVVQAIPSHLLRANFTVIFSSSGSRSQSASAKDESKRLAAERLKTYRRNTSITSDGAVGRPRRTAESTARVIPRKTTDEVIRDETARIELAASYLQSTVDVSGEPRLASDLVEEFKKLAVFASPVLQNAFAKKAKTKLINLNWRVADDELVSMLRRD